MMTFKELKSILDKMTPEQLDRLIYCESDNRLSTVKGMTDDIYPMIMLN
jgi:hypothetical protein